MTTDITKHIATIQVTAEPNGWAVWRDLTFDCLKSSHKEAMERAVELVRTYKPNYNYFIEE